MEKSQSMISDEKDAVELYKQAYYESIRTLPQGKLKRPEEGQKGAILFFYGTFCPFHYGHYDTMKKAEDYVRNTLKIEVLGGFISPCHPSYLYSKLGKDSIPNSTRNHLIKLALEDDQTWELDPYMQGTKDFVDNFQLLLDFYDRIIEAGFVKDEIEIYWIMGTDNFGFTVLDELADKNFHQIVIENRDSSSQKKFQSITERIQEMQIKDRIHLLECQLLSVSSSQIREICNSKSAEKLDETIGIPRVCDYIRSQGLWQDANSTFYTEKVMEASTLGFHKASDMYKKLDNKFITTILRKSTLLSLQDEVVSFEHERIGVYLGWSGKIFRVFNVKIQTQQTENQDIKEFRNPSSFVLKMSASTHHIVRAEDEACFLMKVGQKFCNPLFPKMHLLAYNKNQKDKERAYYFMMMEDISWGQALDAEQGLNVSQLISIIDSLAEFQAFHWNNGILKEYEDNLLYPCNKKEVYAIFKNSMISVNKQMQKGSLKDHEMYPLVSWMTNFIDDYFDILSTEPRTICHGDFTQGNVMIGQKDGRDRNCFIDWQTLFIGNGFVDLTFIMYYGTKAEEFQKDPGLSDKCFYFFMECLSRHGVSSRKLNMKKMYQRFQQAKIFSMLRFLSGFGTSVMDFPEDGLLRQKWDNNCKHCLEVFNNKDEIFKR